MPTMRESIDHLEKLRNAAVESKTTGITVSKEHVSNLAGFLRARRVTESQVAALERARSVSLPLANYAYRTYWLLNGKKLKDID